MAHSRLYCGTQQAEQAHNRLSRHTSLGALGGGHHTVGYGLGYVRGRPRHGAWCSTTRSCVRHDRGGLRHDAHPGQVRVLRYKVCIVSWAAPRSQYKKKIVSWLRGETLGRDTAHHGYDTAQQCTTIRR